VSRGSLIWRSPRCQTSAVVGEEGNQSASGGAPGKGENIRLGEIDGYGNDVNRGDASESERSLLGGVTTDVGQIIFDAC
jgi:hypothetical protein